MKGDVKENYVNDYTSNSQVRPFSPVLALYVPSVQTWFFLPSWFLAAINSLTIGVSHRRNILLIVNPTCCLHGQPISLWQVLAFDIQPANACDSPLYWLVFF